MRRLVAALAFACALGATSAGRADSLRPHESARLARGETVIREQTLVIDNVESLRRVLPKTKRARLVGTTTDGDQLVELVQGNALMEAQYTIRVRREPREVRFWLDPRRPHGIDDAWGFFRYQPFITSAGEARVLLTYGVMVDVGPGIVRDFFEERIRAALLSVPQLVRRQMAELRRPL